MSPNSTTPQRRRRGGCLLIGAVVAAVVLGVLGVAAWQLRSPEQAVVLAEATEPLTAIEATAGAVVPTLPILVRVDSDTAALAVFPIAAGQPLEVIARTDPRRYVLERERTREADRIVEDIRLKPRRSTFMAVVRAKLGGAIPVLELRLPRDREISLDLNLVRSLSALELGGLDLKTMRLAGHSGGIEVSFQQPLARRLESLEVDLTAGGFSIRQLGNASPVTSTIETQLAVLDLDVRGAWRGDATMTVEGELANGTLWLPDALDLIGFERSGCAADSALREVPLPRLEMSIAQGPGQLVVIDERKPCLTR
ncbi:MAG: hypothetical protein AAF533_30865 [Acidobacteriota bacterium]